MDGFEKEKRRLFSGSFSRKRTVGPATGKFRFFDTLWHRKRFANGVKLIWWGNAKNFKLIYVTELEAKPFIEFIGKVLDFVVFTQGGESLKFVCTDFWVTQKCFAMS